jgi:hypothetical protein
MVNLTFLTPLPGGDAGMGTVCDAEGVDTDMMESMECVRAGVVDCCMFLFMCEDRCVVLADGEFKI